VTVEILVSTTPTVRNAIVVGASSGIGRALALRLARDGYAVGLTGRRVALLEELRREIGAGTRVKEMDVADAAGAMSRLAELIAEMGGVDLVVLNAGTGAVNPDLLWEREEPAILVNVHGFAALAGVAMRHFIGRGRGHLVGISSVSALRGSRHAPAYGASKAFVSNYLEGLWYYAARLGLPIAVTDVQPGFVDTAMTRGQSRTFWVAPVDEAADQIVAAIRRRKKRVVVTRRWRLMAWLMRALPHWLYKRIV
jgi:short-subunit dehydrogenase